MYVEAEISTSSDTSLALPINAVISIEDQFFVLIKRKSEKGKFEFERMKVQVGQTNDDFIEIYNATDFQKGTEFLIEGAFNLIQE